MVIPDNNDVKAEEKILNKQRDNKIAQIGKKKVRKAKKTKKKSLKKRTKQDMFWD